MRRTRRCCWKRCCEWLRIKPDGIYVDATLGAGGHSAAIAQRWLDVRAG